MTRRQRRRRIERRSQKQVRRRIAASAGLSLGATFALGASAEAATFTVTNLSDGAAPGPDGSLRKAITDANAAATEDTITFQSGLTGQITLTNGELPITGNYLYINGPRADQLTISGNSASRIFNVDPAVAGTVFTIYDLTLTGGNVVGSGGAILNEDAMLSIKECVLTGNTAGDDGGALFENGAFASGTNTFIASSTISGNTAGSSGGGVSGTFSFGTIVDSTITGNQVPVGFGSGAGVASNSSSDILDSTITGNGPAASGGGAWGFAGLNLFNTIIADNTATTGPDIADGGTAFDAEFSLVRNPAGAMAINATVPGSNITGVDPQLGTLALNGGTTPNRRPLLTSPVIDKGKSGFGSDQRSLSRHVDLAAFANSLATGADGADMGSVELSAAEAAPPVGAAPPSSTPQKKKKKKKCKKKRKKCKKRKN